MRTAAQRSLFSYFEKLAHEVCAHSVLQNQT